MLDLAAMDSCSREQHVQSALYSMTFSSVAQSSSFALMLHALHLPRTHLRIGKLLDELLDCELVSKHLKGFRTVLRESVVHVKADGLRTNACTQSAVLTWRAQRACQAMDMHRWHMLDEI